MAYNKLNGMRVYTVVWSCADFNSYRNDKVFNTQVVGNFMNLDSALKCAYDYIGEYDSNDSKFRFSDDKINMLENSVTNRDVSSDKLLWFSNTYVKITISVRCLYDYYDSWND